MATASSETSDEKILSTGSLPDGTLYHVRHMKISDIPEVLQVWKEIGLYEGIHTIETFMQVDPDGFFVAVNQRDGRIIGTCAGVFVDPETAFIGLYAVRSAYQGMRVGLKVWQQMMEHIGDRNAGLYAVTTQYDTYKYRAGFEHEDRVKVQEYFSDQVTPENLSKLVDNLDNVEIVEVNNEIQEKIIAYDEQLVNHNRGKLLKAALVEPESLALAAVSSETGQLLGYGMIRRNILDRAMPGPIFADTAEIGEFLLRQLIQQFPIAMENGLNLMTPDLNPGGPRIAEKLNCTLYSTLPRLFRKSIPKVDFDRIFCIHNPDFSPV